MDLLCNLNGGVVNCAASFIHYRLAYCNFLNMPSSQLSQLQCLINSAAQAQADTKHVTKHP